jgi:hypothetical protein
MGIEKCDKRTTASTLGIWSGWVHHGSRSWYNCWFSVEWIKDSDNRVHFFEWDREKKRVLLENFYCFFLCLEKFLWSIYYVFMIFMSRTTGHSVPWLGIKMLQFTKDSAWSVWSFSEAEFRSYSRLSVAGSNRYLGICIEKYKEEREFCSYCESFVGKSNIYVGHTLNQPRPYCGSL